MIRDRLLPALVPAPVSNLAELTRQRLDAEFERRVLPELRRRLKRQDEEPLTQAPNADDVRQRFALLLETSLTDHKGGAESRLLERLIDEMLPDEARIMAALSDGEGAVLIHVAVAPTVGGMRMKGAPATRRVAENFSSVGKAAGLLNPGLTPMLVARLRERGLLRTEPEDPKRREEYDLLETDVHLRETMEQIERDLGMKPRCQRRMLTLSRAGRWFCAAVVS